MNRLSAVPAGTAVMAMAGLLRGPKPVDPRCEKVLPVATADRLTGRTDLMLFGRGAVPAGGGTCNYATGAKKMVFLVSLIDEKSRAAEHFVRHKGEPAYTPHQRDVPGLGDAAFTGGSDGHLLMVRKGSMIVSVAAMVQLDRATHQTHATLTRDQLIAVAREVVGKL